MKIDFRLTTLKSKLTVFSTVVVIAISAILVTSIFAFWSYEVSSDRLLDAFRSSRELNKVNHELASLNNLIALQLIDGEQRDIPTSVEETRIYKWLKENAPRYLPEKKRVYFMDRWKEYFDLAEKIHQNVTRLDNTLDEYLTYTHEEVYRVKTGNIPSLAKLSFYRWVNDDKKLREQHLEIRRAFSKLRDRFNVLEKRESSGEIVPEDYRELLYAIEGAKDSLYNVQARNEKYSLVFKNRLRNITAELSAMFDKVRSKNLEHEKIRKQKQQNLGDNLVMLLVTVTVLFFGLFLVVVIFMGRSILNPVYKTREKLRELSQKGGDLRVELPVLSDDEIGKMTRSMNEFILHLREIVRSVKQSSYELNSISENISDGSEDASSRISGVSDSVDNISNNLSDITSRLKKTAGQMQSVSDIVITLSRRSDSSSKMLDDALSSMNEIQEANLEIQEITEVVDEIAFQTNMLSLNAAIEAARAGEYGKGFAVVAKEVRDLSRRSSKSARQISELLKSTGNKITSEVDTLKETNDNFTGMLDEFRKIFNDITTLSKELRVNTDEVSRVDGDVASIQSTLNNNASYVEEVASSTRDMSRHTKVLFSNMEEFKVD